MIHRDDWYMKSTEVVASDLDKEDFQLPGALGLLLEVV